MSAHDLDRLRKQLWMRCKVGLRLLRDGRIWNVRHEKALRLQLPLNDPAS
jgi:hypothetical protein